MIALIAAKRRRRRRRGKGDVEAFSMSFLDAISCGFGAIVMLLVLTKIGEPGALEDARRDLDALIQSLEAELYEIRGESDVLERDLRSARLQLSEERELIARLRGDLSKIQGQFASTAELSEIQDDLEGRLLAAQQDLTEEMLRLLGRDYQRPIDDATVGGIPVDSEYIIFVIDTSGSMQKFAWSSVVEKMQETLEIYPKVKGIQILDDMGRYMFPTYAGKWMPDTGSRRRHIINALRRFQTFSNSSPVEGIQRAVRAFASDDKRISIYVFGDEFATNSSIDSVLRAVEKVNTRDAQGRPRVRIHAVGFPTIFTASGITEETAIRFATLMRALTHENAGTFVGLTEARQ